MQAANAPTVCTRSPAQTQPEPEADPPIDISPSTAPCNCCGAQTPRLHELLLQQMLSIEPDTTYADRFPGRAHAPRFPLHSSALICPLRQSWADGACGIIDNVNVDYSALRIKLTLESGRALVAILNSNTHAHALYSRSAIPAFCITPHPHNFNPALCDAHQLSPITIFAFSPHGTNRTDRWHDGPIAISLPPMAEIRHYRPPRSPLIAAAWDQCLREHPDRDFAHRVVNQIRYGAAIGYQGDRTAHRDTRNLPSVSENMESQAAVAAAIQKDADAAHVSGPFRNRPLYNLRCSPLGTVAKQQGPNRPTKYRVISHQSWPAGESNNEMIAPGHMLFDSFDTAVHMLSTHGSNSVMAAYDVSNAYKNIPVRLQDRHLLGFIWMGLFYFSSVLMFGLRSSGFIWEEYAIAFQWILSTLDSIGFIMHYVDDFFVLTPPLPTGTPNWHDACQNDHKLLARAQHLGLPLGLEPDKRRGPALRIVFLGLTLDSSSMTIEIPEQRMADTVTMLENYANKQRATARELQSLAGKMVYLTRIMRMGRAFLGRILDLKVRAGSGHAHIALDDAFRADVRFWLDFLPICPRTLSCPDTDWTDSDTMQLYTDASLEYGMGGYFHGQWFSQQWSPAQLAAAIRNSRPSMPYLELLALVSAAATWGHLWRGKRVSFFTDCEPVHTAVNKLGSSHPQSQCLLRSLVAISITHSFELRAAFIAGRDNTLADPLSRGRIDVFLQRCPHAASWPTRVLPLPHHSYEI